MRAARIHDRCSGAEAVCLAEIARLPADPEVSGIALAQGGVGAGVVFRAAVGRAWVAGDGACRVLERVFRARDADCELCCGCADRRAALRLDRQLGLQRVGAAVRVVLCLEVTGRAGRARGVEGSRRPGRALALLGAGQRRVGGRLAQRRARRTRRHQPPRRKGVEGARQESVRPGTEVACEALAALEGRRLGALPKARGAFAREHVGHAVRPVAGVRRTRGALARPLRGDRGVLPRARRARQAGGHASLGAVRAGGAFAARLAAVGAQSCREFSRLAGCAAGRIVTC